MFVYAAAAVRSLGSTTHHVGLTGWNVHLREREAGEQAAIHTDDVGWATAAALFVMRPEREMQELRSVGRVGSVFLGALAAVAFVRTSPPPSALSTAAIVAVAALGATRESRWYVGPFFTTFLVLTLLLYSDATAAQERWRFNERVGETVLGVALAYFYGLAVPQILKRLKNHPTAA